MKSKPGKYNGSKSWEMTSAQWGDLPKHKKHTTTEKVRMALALDPNTGATVLVPVTITPDVGSKA